MPFRPRAVEETTLGPSLEASFDDPILLTVTAARPRASYHVDEGYTLVRTAEGALSLATDTAGDLGLGFQVDGAPMVVEAEWAGKASIVRTTSDALVARFGLGKDLDAELWFVAATSSIGALEVRVRNRGATSHEVIVAPFLRRCSGGYTGIRSVPGGVTLRHVAEVDAATRAFGAGTYVENLTGALVAEDPSASVVSLAECGASLADDARSVLKGAPTLGGDGTSVVGLRLVNTVEPNATLPYRAFRAVLDASDETKLEPTLDDARRLSLPKLLEEGEARLGAAPKLVPTPATREQQLLVHSSFTLLEGLMLPAEGKFRHDYYLFSREPTWWFARLGQHIHESFSMILLAAIDPAAAMASQRNLIERVEADGYLPYNVGPAVEQTSTRTAAAPLLDFVSWEIFAVTKDRGFLADAYAAGQRVHAFWLRERDQNQNGLAEWGGLAVSESLRDLENAVWTQVAPPNEVEAVDLNTMMVMEEKHLAKMADELGKPEDAKAWRAQADARATKINARMWDDETGFYYHSARDKGGFTYKNPNDLKRMEIAGLLPLWAGIVPPERLPVVLAKLTDPKRFWRANGIPGLAADDPYYSPSSSRCCRWNGPVWVPWMFLLHRGLVDAGRADLARELTTRTSLGVVTQLRRVHQFREHYDPDRLDAPNDSMPNYCWSALVTQMMLEDK